MQTFNLSNPPAMTDKELRLIKSEEARKNNQKYCPQCDLSFDLSEFYFKYSLKDNKDINDPNNYQYLCKICYNQDQRNRKKEKQLNTIVKQANNFWNNIISKLEEIPYTSFPIVPDFRFFFSTIHKNQWEPYYIAIQRKYPELDLPDFSSKEKSSITLFLLNHHKIIKFAHIVTQCTKCHQFKFTFDLPPQYNYADIYEKYMEAIRLDAFRPVKYLFSNTFFKPDYNSKTGWSRSCSNCNHSKKPITQTNLPQQKQLETLLKENEKLKAQLAIIDEPEISPYTDDDMDLDNWITSSPKESIHYKDIFHRKLVQYAEKTNEDGTILIMKSLQIYEPKFNYKFDATVNILRKRLFSKLPWPNLSFQNHPLFLAKSPDTPESYIIVIDKDLFYNSSSSFKLFNDVWKIAVQQYLNLEFHDFLPI